MMQVGCCPFPETAGNADVCLGGGFQCAPFYHAHFRVNNCFGSQMMCLSGHQSEYVAGQKESADLPAAISQNLVGADGTANDLINKFCRFAFAVNFFVLGIGMFSCDECRVSLETETPRHLQWEWLGIEGD